MMFGKLCRWLLYRVLGWEKRITIEHPDKFIICLAPHTSNWDFILGQLYSHAEGMHINYLMKKEWFFWPLGALFRRTGGIPVDRSKKTSMTDGLAEIARNAREFRLCITPEGTRKANPNWKKGFYFIAKKADIPILLYGLDYKRKLIQCTKYITPKDEIDKDFVEIRDYFKDFQGCHPEKFAY